LYISTTASTAGLTTEVAGNRTTDINNTLFLILVIGLPVAVTTLFTVIVICSVVLINQLQTPVKPTLPFSGNSKVTRFPRNGLPNTFTTLNPVVQARPPAALARHDRYNQAWMIGVANRPGAIGNRVYARQHPARYGNQNVAVSSLA